MTKTKTSKTVGLNLNQHIDASSIKKPLFRVGFASTDWSHVDNSPVPNGCTWYRCMLPAQQLNVANIHASVGFLESTKKGEFTIRRVNNTVSDKNDIIVLKVVMMQKALDNFDRARRMGQKIVVDVDDLFEGLHPTNFAHNSTDPKRWPDNNRDIYMQIIEAADALIVSTQFLYDHYKKKHPKKPVFMVRNAIDIERYKPRKMKKRSPIIGWLGAVPWRSEDLEQLKGFLGSYLSSRQIRFHHAGHLPWAPGAHLRLRIEPRYVSVSPMVPLFELPTVYSHFDIGIVPLNDIPFNRAKSFIKGLEYTGGGIPFVASALPEYEFLAQNGVGRVAKTESEWASHFDELLDFKTRSEEAERQYEIVKERFSMQSSARQWVDVFKAIHAL